MGRGLLIAVAGAHLEGQPLNHQLTDRGGRLVALTTTADCYRFYALSTDPPKPGLLRVPDHDLAASAIEIEVWSLAADEFGEFVDAVPPPLVIGRVLTADGANVAGFLCEPIAIEGATEITEFGGWRSYLASPAARR
jgi:allophanate hydrolase